jgi:tetratricopeptide (TPR) repeat protein
MHGQYEEALPAVQQCIESGGDDYRLLLLQGKIQESLYRYDRAIYSYSQALRLNDEVTEIKSALAALYAKLGQNSIAAGLYAQLAAAEPEVNRWKMNHATVLQASGKHRQALNLLLKVASTDSLNWIVQRDMGDCYFRLNQPDSAAVCYQKSVDSYPNNRSFIQLMRINIKNKKYQEATQTGREALKLDSTNAEVWKQMGLAYFFRDMKLNALKTFGKALSLGDSSYVTCSHLGLLAYPMNCEAGIHFLQMAVRQKPDELSAMFYLACAYGNCKQLDKSFALLDTINRKIEDMIKEYDTIHIRAEIERGDIYRNCMHYDEAIGTYLAVLREDPSQTELYSIIADIYNYALHKKKEALDWYIRYMNKFDTEWETKEIDEKSPKQNNIKNIIERLKIDLFFEEE